MGEVKKLFKNGLLDENPVFIQVIGLCPVLAVTTSVINGIGMGLATTAVLMMSNTLISLVRNHTPNTVRIPMFIIIIASFASIVQFLLQAFLPEINASLGIFIPLIIVNCIVFARAESFAFKNKPLVSALDGLSMGLGFTLALFCISFFREIFGGGTIFGITIIPESVPRMIIMLMAPGAFFTLGTIMVVLSYLKNKGGAK